MDTGSSVTWVWGQELWGKRDVGAGKGGQTSWMDTGPTCNLGVGAKDVLSVSSTPECSCSEARSRPELARYLNPSPNLNVPLSQSR